MKLQISLASTFMSLILAVYRSLWKFRKDICICYGFGSLHGVLIRPITLERAFRKALKCVVVMEKWLSENWSSLEGETRWNLACVISLVLHIMLPESRSFIFSHSQSGVEIFCHKDSQQWKPIKFWLLRRTHCQGLSRHKLLATTKCPAAGHGFN